MAIISKEHQDKIQGFRDNINDWNTYWKENNDRFHRVRKFVFDTTLTEADKNLAQDQQKPEIDVNLVFPFLARQLGEFSKQVPSLKVRGKGNTNPAQIELVEGIVRSIARGSRDNSLEYQLYKETTSGGFSVVEVITEYEGEDTFNQIIRLDKPIDPTLCGFDPLAKYPHKGDGKFAFKLTPKTEDEFKHEYPNIDLSKIEYTRQDGEGINWFYNQSKKKVLYIADYYHKKESYEVMYLVSNPSNKANPLTMTRSEYNNMISEWDSIEQQPIIIKKRRRYHEEVWHYRFIGNDTLIEKPYSLHSDKLPLVYIDGESIMLQEGGYHKQITRPYIMGAIDAQRAKNFFLSASVNEIENMRQSDIMVPKESIPKEEEYQEAWLNPQKAKAALIYNHVDPSDPTGQRLLPPPQYFARGQVNNSIIQLYEMMDKTLQGTIGSYDAQLGIQQSQLSGVAIQEGATQSNATAMPYIVNYLISLEQIANIIVDLIPKYYHTLRTVPIINSNGKEEFKVINDSAAPNSMLNYDSSILNVVVSPGVNFEIQKNKALQVMTTLMQSSTAFNQLINSNLPILVDNLDIRGQDLLKSKSEQLMEEQEEIQQKTTTTPNPAMIQVQLEQQKLQLENQKQQMNFLIEKQKLQQEKIKTEMLTLQSFVENATQLKKAHAEDIRTHADLNMDALELSLKHEGDTL